MKVHSIAQGIWPQGKVDRLGPVGVCMKQLLACAFQEVLDGSLGNAILEVGIYVTKGGLLSCIVACLSECVVVKLPVVTVVVEDLHSMFSHVSLEGKLGGKCFYQ